MATYIALIRKDAKSSFGVEFPDFPGCISAGDTLDECLRMAGKALALHVRGMTKDREPIPEPSALDDVDKALLKGAVPALITLAPLQGRALRLNVTLEENLVAQIDRMAKKRGTSRSGFLAQAAQRELAQRGRVTVRRPKATTIVE